MSTILVTTLSFGIAALAPSGSVTGVSVMPAKAETGEQVAIAVTGTNPCGAVHLITGDGAAVAHPITGLPSTHAHAYRKPGTYTIVAQGMGNCDGEATTTIQVSGEPLDPDPPPAPRAEITGVELDPVPGRAGRPVTFIINGRGTCELSLEFGDGNTRTLRGELPQRATHTYAQGGRYTVVASGEASCEGRHAQELEVVDAERAAQLDRVSISPAPATAGQPVSIRVEGTGRCVYSVDFGDGNEEPREAALPDAIIRYYHRPAMYTVTAAAKAPCRGSDRVTFEVRGDTPPASSLTGFDLSPARPATGEQVTFSILGSGDCRVSVDFGDGNRRTYVGVLPLRVPHVYDWPGRYTAHAAAEAPCAGSRRIAVDVTRSP